MRRSLFLFALWLAGTLGATGVVFFAVSKLSSTLGDASQEDRTLGLPTTVARVPPTTAAAGSPSTATTSTVAPTTSAESATTTIDATSTTVATGTPDEDPQAPATNGPGGTPSPSVPTGTIRGTTATTPATTVSPFPTTTTTLPPPTTTQPPVVTTQPPATTAPAGPCQPGFKGRGLNGNTIAYKTCAEGVYFVGAVPANGWTWTVGAYGPPSVSVTFTRVADDARLTCNIALDSEGLINLTGDCA